LYVCTSQGNNLKIIKMAETVIVKYRGIELQLEGDIIQAYDGRYNEMSVSVEFETQEVYAGGVLITNLLTEENLTDLDALAAESIR